MCSDGIRSRYELASVRSLPVKEGAEALVRMHAKNTDDASCLLALGVGTGAATGGPEVQAATGARFTFPVRARGDPECVAVHVRGLLRERGFDARAQWEVSIAASELATNILKFAGRGEIHLEHLGEPHDAVIVEAVDRGQGIDTVELAVADGFSEGALLTPDRSRRTGQGLGVGLGSIHRLMDHVAIESAPGEGTRVVACKLARRGAHIGPLIALLASRA
jgi:serine/threonine-protein kinase RsbT